MSQQRIVILGMGSIGANFADQLSMHRRKGIIMAYLPELEDLYGIGRAKDLQMTAITLEELALAEPYDLLFDFSSNPNKRKVITDKLSSCGQPKALLLNEAVAELIWTLINEDVSADAIAAMIL